MRLWSYGDSHAAGHELGAVSDLGRHWLAENAGYLHRTDARNTLGKDYEELIKNKWYDYLVEIMPNSEPRICSPNLSFAGIIAEKLNRTLINRAVPGASNDLIVRRMIEDIDSWKSSDIILVCFVNSDRYMPEHNIDQLNYKSHNLPFNIQYMFEKHGPSRMSFKLWNQGLIQLMQSLSNNVKLVSSVEVDIEVEGFDVSKNLTNGLMSLTKFVGTKWETEEMRYPGGHFAEVCHEEYANYLIENLNFHSH